MENSQLSNYIKLPQLYWEEQTLFREVLMKRRSIRFFQSTEISIQEVSNILWSANGVSDTQETSEGKLYFKTAPSASNHQEIEIYVFDKNGVYFYNSELHIFQIVKTGDNRSILGKLPFFRKAPISFCLVANMNKMVRYNKDEFRINLYSAMDTGYVSQNIYLYCAARKLATVACGMINRSEIGEFLCLQNAKVMLVHPVGFKKYM